MAKRPDGNTLKITKWTQKTLDRAVQEILRSGVFGGMLLESRPVWQLHGRVLIGQVRDADERDSSWWIVTGKVPLDHIDLAVAATPRDAARHFALKWQLDAARCEDPAVQKSLSHSDGPAMDQLATYLVEKSEFLYGLIEDDSLWGDAG